MLPLPIKWKEERFSTMYKGVMMKFESNLDAKELLISTQSLLLAKNHPNDYYWGIGFKKNGLNKLGEILMSVRETILIKSNEK